MQNEKGRIQKGELGSGDGKHLTPGASGQFVRRDVPAWWLAVPQSEKAVIRDVVMSIRGLKRSKSPQISEAARKWERGIVCFIRFRLMSETPRVRRRTISSPASERNQRGVSPSRG